MACLDLTRRATTLVAILIVMGSAQGLVLGPYRWYRYFYKYYQSQNQNHAVPLVGSSSSTLLSCRVAMVLKSTVQQEEDSSILPITGRRQKKNKYAKFSKLRNESADPLEILLKESERKNRELIELQQRAQEERQKKSRPQPEIKPLPKLEFPDTQTIDPYDPQTFGYVELGSVLGAHGVHGWIKVRASLGAVSAAAAAAASSSTITTTTKSTSWQSRLCSPGVRHIKPANKRAPRRVILLQGRHRRADEYLVQLDDVHDRDSAQKLRGATLYIREEQQREDDSENTSKTADGDQDEYFVQDLVGLEVFLTGGDCRSDNGPKCFVGTVRGVVFADEFCSVPGLGHDYLELLLPRGVGGTASWKDELVLVPLVPQIVPRVDIPNGEIYLDPPAGLLDLKYIRQEKTRIKGFLPSSSEQS